VFLNISRYDNLLDVRVIPAKKDIAFVEYMDERSATVAKEALHNYKIDGENKIKVCTLYCRVLELIPHFLDYLRTQMMFRLLFVRCFVFTNCTVVKGSLHPDPLLTCQNSLPLSVTP